MILDDLHEIGFVTLNDRLTRSSLNITKPNTIQFNTHWHEQLEILFVIEGHPYFEISGKTYIGAPGDIFIVNPCCIHSGYAKDEGARYYALILNLKGQFGGNATADRAFKPFISQTSAFVPYIKDPQLFDLLLSTVEKPEEISPSEELLYLSDIYKILGILQKKYVDQEYEKPKVDERFEEILEYISENFKSPDITTELICKKFKYDEAYFCRKFKKLTGLSPLFYIRIMRLERAKHLIKHSQLDMHGICEECGFKDVN